MLDKIKAFWARVVIHWNVVLAALVAALPSLLDQLGVIDLKPILGHVMPQDFANLVVGLMPFILAFLRPLVALTPKEPVQ